MPIVTQAPGGKKWLQRFERLMVAMEITSEKRKRALLLHYAGTEEVDEISNGG